MKVGEEGARDPEQRRQMKPLGSFGPGERNRAMLPATNPITMIQVMNDTTIRAR